ncbi:MAG TPA: GWxTD domain-containing protein [Thermoanaerobaculia bacterium]|nr:GWxTD domain-containing protein [Thermoanaerobaculia bacterium]
MTSCAGTRLLRLLLAAAILAVLAGCASGGGHVPGVEHNLADLTNPALGPDYSQWLVGPIAYLATKGEVAAYLALKDDRAAESFINQFWVRRNPHPQRPDNSLLQTFEERGAEADRLYGEAGFLGRRTDRGTIYVLYGKPQRVDYEVPPISGAPPIEVWSYGTDAPAGLTGRQPSPIYRFMKHGDLTVFYLPGRSDPRLRAHPLPGGP